MSASPRAVDRGTWQLGLSEVVRATIPDKGGHRASDRLNRDVTSSAPNKVWVTGVTYVRAWAGSVYTAFICDVLSQRIVTWHRATPKHVDLV